MVQIFDVIVIVCYFFTAAALPMILASFVLPWRERPRLDWAFIAAWASFSVVVLFGLIRYYLHWSGFTADLARAVIWVFVAASECAVLYYTYKERNTLTRWEAFLSHLPRKVQAWISAFRSFLKSIVTGRETN